MYKYCFFFLLAFFASQLFHFVESFSTQRNSTRTRCAHLHFYCWTFVARINLERQCSRTTFTLAIIKHKSCIHKQSKKRVSSLDLQLTDNSVPIDVQLLLIGVFFQGVIALLVLHTFLPVFVRVFFFVAKVHEIWIHIRWNKINAWNDLLKNDYLWRKLCGGACAITLRRGILLESAAIRICDGESRRLQARVTVKILL